MEEKTRSLTLEEKNELESIALLVKKDIMSNKKELNFRDPFQVISSLDKYIIIRFPGESNIQGFSERLGDFKCIYINSNENLGRQHYAVWHEYYHTIDDISKVKVSYKGDKSIEERKAEYFASCMLMDRKEVEDFIILNYNGIQDLNEIDLIKVQQEFKVSYEAVKVKLSEIYDNNLFFKFKINSEDRAAEFQRVTKELGYTTELIVPTKDFCIPKVFFEMLRFNLLKKKIDVEKATKALDFFDEKGCEYKW